MVITRVLGCLFARKAAAEQMLESLRSADGMAEIPKTHIICNKAKFLSLYFLVAVCFVALIHVELELHAHRHMLKALKQQGHENVHPENPTPKEVQDSKGSSFEMAQNTEKNNGELLFAIR